MRPRGSGSLSPRLVLGLARVVLALRYPVMLLRYRYHMGHWPNPALPRSYNERMLWRKIFDRNPIFVTVTDKVAAKAFITARCPSLRQARLLWVGRRPEDLPQALALGDVMLKASNGCSANIAVRGGRPGRGEIERKMRRWLGPRFRRRPDEWAYWGVVPQVLAEQLLALGGGELPTDIKVHVCCGEVAHIWVADTLNQRSLVLDADGDALPSGDAKYAARLPHTERLGNLAREAARIAPTLAEGLDYARVDFLVDAEGLVAGEITIYPAAGFDTWSSPAVAQRLERLWDLRQSYFLQRPHRGLAGLYAAALSVALPTRS